jgi:hypothetical protein
MRRKSPFLSSILSLIIAASFVWPSFAIPAQAAGASLYLSPNAGSYDVGKSFNVSVVINSGGGVGINSADGVIKFDPSYLTVTKVSDTASIFKMWTTAPTYSNTAGTVSFSGGSPGSYTGSAGTVFSISFSSKKSGTTDVSFSSGKVLANDGKGTDVLSGMGKATFSIVEPKKEEPVKKEEVVKPVKKETVEKPAEEKPKGLLPPLPEINSKTHPDDKLWYANNDPEFSWKVLADLSGVSHAVTKNPTDDPGKENKGIIETEKYENLEDGVQYFHLKYQNQYGWSQIAHKKIMIDATPPQDFEVKLDNSGDNTNPVPHLVFFTTDKTSGLDHYEVSVGDKRAKLTLDDMKSGFYQTEILAPGDYLASVAAYDKAGNAASTTLSFSVEPLRAPIITSMPETISKNEDLIIQGTSFYSNVKIKVYISQSGKETIEGEAETDEAGNWSFLYKEGLGKGNYEVWAQVIDKRGAMSLGSSKRVLTVVSPSIVCEYGLWIILVLILIIISLITYIIYERRKFSEERRRIKREAEELKVKMGKIFYALREEVDELMELADKKAGLSESERRVKEKLQESLDISEEFIGKEIEDVEKEIALPKKK